jgi:hypothetical protein
VECSSGGLSCDAWVMLPAFLNRPKNTTLP